MVEPLYQKEVTCHHCGMGFKTSRVRPSFKKPVRRDTDFCAYYMDETANPEFYVVRVCPYCGFASTESFSESLTDAQKLQFQDKIANYWQITDYGGARSWEEAMKCYKLALLCAQLKKEKPRVISGILHHIAWLYRYKKNHEQESKFLEFALESYIEVYEQEGASVNDARLMYLIGELSRRLKRYNEAVRWFSRVVNDKTIMDAAMIQASREQWQMVREDMQRDKLSPEAIEEINKEAENA
ncbi:DUF2225 domain-containing protein [Xylanibacillus composti]|uniref:DUF2225 domain-containing protein n=1 Tax=Xylanibacillus composti TaxID=1572762 RepID=A0A8J4M2D3_9BACL|nr:DUF2225 domain-containing protein [Xylanibacillus composti]MDT9723541.1 DUF2225 domain-containing protein [Xylanibacillus composti]GIQ68421.1 hypothetical protein XYCOK13_12450 [Xylanibacillus composti]